jgi:hypothetical protein
MKGQPPAAINLTCRFKKPNGELCKRSVHPGENTCWQHTRGLRHKWNSLTKNQTIVFLGMIAGILLGVVGVVQSRPSGYMQLDEVFIHNQQLTAGDRLSMNVGIRNRGGSPVRNEYQFMEVALVPLAGNADDIDRQKRADFKIDALQAHEKLLDKGQKGVLVGEGDTLWDTLTLPNATTPPLSQEQVEMILSGRIRLYVYLWSRWKDAPEDYEQCLSLQPPTKNDLQDKDVIWHTCAN